MADDDDAGSERGGSDAASQVGSQQDEEEDLTLTLALTLTLPLARSASSSTSPCYACCASWPPTACTRPTTSLP